MSPLRKEWVNGSDFTPVSPALSRALGGDFISAAVAARIQFRMNYYGEMREGIKWWACSMANLAEDIGISENQVRRGLGVLETAGMLERKQFQDKGPWDRTMSLRLLFDEVTPSAPQGEPSALEGGSPSAL